MTKLEKKLFASISSKRFQLCLSSVSYDYFWLLNQTYLRHTLESNNENEKFNHVTFVNIEEFLMQNDSITLIFTKNYGVWFIISVFMLDFYLPYVDSFSRSFFKRVSIGYYLLAKTTSRTIILRPGCVSSFVLNDYRKIVKQLNINNDVWRNSKIASGDILFQCYYYYFQFGSLVDYSMVKSDFNLSSSSWRF